MSAVQGEAGVASIIDGRAAGFLLAWSPCALPRTGQGLVQHCASGRPPTPPGYDVLLSFVLDNAKKALQKRLLAGTSRFFGVFPKIQDGEHDFIVNNLLHNKNKERRSEAALGPSLARLIMHRHSLTERRRGPFLYFEG